MNIHCSHDIWNKPKQWNKSNFLWNKFGPKNCLTCFKQISAFHILYYISLGYEAAHVNSMSGSCVVNFEHVNRVQLVDSSVLWGFSLCFSVFLSQIKSTSMYPATELTEKPHMGSELFDIITIIIFIIIPAL